VNNAIGENIYIIKNKNKSSYLNFDIDIDDLTDGIWEKNILTNEIYISPKLKKILGYSNNKLENSMEHLTALIHPEDIEKVLNSLENYLANKVTKFETEYRVKSKNGEYKWFLVRAKVVYDKNLNPLSILGINTDITEKKIAKKNLSESEERYRTLIELSPDAIFLESKDRNLFSNCSGAKILGFSSPEEILNKKPMDFIHPDCHEEVKSKLSHFLKNNLPIKDLQTKIIKKDGTVIDVEVLSKRIPFKDTIASMTIVRDITDRKNAENNLKAVMEENLSLLNKTLEYDKLKTEFFSNISHELKTPLNVLSCATQLMSSYQTNNQCKDCYGFSKYLKTMKQNSYRLLRLINNLIDITKLDSGFMQMNFKNNDIVSIVENITLSIGDYIKSNSIALEFHTDVEEKIIACDADMMERIMLNLLSNAIKCTPSKGNISVNIFDNKDSITLTVKDTGIGIPKDKQEIIFDRFRQVNSSLNRVHEGSGIGLSLVKSLVELHQGSICVNSEENKGTEFIINLPAKVVNNEPLTISEDQLYNKEKIEKIHIEFSDIYT